MTSSKQSPIYQYKLTNHSDTPYSYSSDPVQLQWQWQWQWQRAIRTEIFYEEYHMLGYRVSLRTAENIYVCIEAADCWAGSPTARGGTGTKKLPAIGKNWFIACLHFELHVLRSTWRPSRSSQPLRETAASTACCPESASRISRASTQRQPTSSYLPRTRPSRPVNVAPQLCGWDMCWGTRALHNWMVNPPRDCPLTP